MVSPPIPQPTWQQSWAVTQSKTLMAHFRSWEQLLKDKLGHIFTLVLVGRTIRELNHEDATHVAAAYYAILSLSPSPSASWPCSTRRMAPHSHVRPIRGSPPPAKDRAMLQSYN